jgi:hypothetical protein
MKPSLAIILCLMLAAAGCDETSHASASLEALPQTVVGNGVAKGIVRFIGDAPQMKQIQATDACCKGEPFIFEQTVVVNPNATLKNSFVYIEGAPKLNGVSRPPAVVDQVRCQYLPHSVGVQIGQPLAVRSSDPTMHNVHFTPSKNPARNLSMTGAGQESRVSFISAEFENSFFAVTNETGEFAINGIPPGNYTLVAWHEMFGRQQQNITIGSEGVVESEFVFRKNG